MGLSSISLDTVAGARDTWLVDNRGSPCDRAGSLTAPARSLDPNSEGRVADSKDQSLPWSTEKSSVACGRWTWQPQALSAHGESEARRSP
jgi:hypothetical protein